jgi:hypothetical protein
MRVVECVRELTAGAACSTIKIQYIASAHTQPGSDPGTFWDVSSCTVGDRCGTHASQLPPKSPRKYGYVEHIVIYATWYEGLSNAQAWRLQQYSDVCSSDNFLGIYGLNLTNSTDNTRFKLRSEYPG